MRLIEKEEDKKQKIQGELIEKQKKAQFLFEQYSKICQISGKPAKLSLKEESDSSAKLVRLNHSPMASLSMSPIKKMSKVERQEKKLKEKCQKFEIWIKCQKRKFFRNLKILKVSNLHPILPPHPLR